MARTTGGDVVMRLLGEVRDLQATHEKSTVRIESAVARLAGDVARLAGDVERLSQTVERLGQTVDRLGGEFGTYTRQTNEHLKRMVLMVEALADDRNRMGVKLNEHDKRLTALEKKAG